MRATHQLSLMDLAAAKPATASAPKGSAIFSSEVPTPLYRYRLERFIAESGPTIAWIMVNPSVADATADDATIRKVMGFSRRLGAGRVVVGNLFAFRATDIKGLRTAADPIGLENDGHLRRIIRDATTCIVAWGPCAKLPPHLRRRWRQFNDMAAAAGVRLMCLGTAQDGQPRHPLMQGYDRQLVPWIPPNADGSAIQSASLQPVEA